MYFLKKIIILKMILIFSLLSISWGQDILDMKKASEFLIKSLTFDRNFERRSGKKFTLAVIYMDNEAESVRNALSNLENAAKSEWKDRDVEVKSIKFESVAKILKSIKKEKINCIFIHESMAKALSSIQQVTRGKKIPSLTFSEKFVEQGVSIGIYNKNNKPKLIINRKASIVEGINFTPNLFKIAKLVTD